jgi:UDP:flavonoid glycosyltransferase YjiC (YdhE family)
LNTAPGVSNRAPDKTLRLILEALRLTGQRAIIAAGWGGVRAEKLPEGVFAVESVPHRWLFPRVAGVVHHGGAGTTAEGLRAGAPAMIIPHMADQPYWGRRVHELGVGVKPVPRHKLTAEALAAGLRQLVGDDAMRARARALGEIIQAERGVEVAVGVIEESVSRMAG